MVFLDKNSEEKVYKTLSNILGLGSYNSRFLCNKFGFQSSCTLKDLENRDLEQLKNFVLKNYVIDKFLVQKMSTDVKNKIDLGIYEGKRHNLGYPVRGQRTLSNGKTQRNLHRFRFYYDSDLFSHNFFKNQRKSKKTKKITKLSKKKKLNKEIKLKNYSSKFSNNRINHRTSNLPTKLVTKPIGKSKKDLAYLEKLNKIKVERKLQINQKFNRDLEQSKKVHPYFLNIQKSEAKKLKKKMKNKVIK